MIKLPPHLFGAAEHAFFAMKVEKKDQVILMTGEAGSGKTEACKIILSYLAKVGSNRDDSFDAANDDKHIL